MRKLCYKIGIKNDLHQRLTQSEKQKTAEDSFFLKLNSKMSKDEETHEPQPK